jgi:hypothetical protein
MPPSRHRPLQSEEEEEEEEAESSTYLTDEAPYVFRRSFPTLPSTSQTQTRKRTAAALSSSPSSPPESEPGPSVKRQRRPGERVRTRRATPHASAAGTSTPAEIEAIDLTEEANPLKDALQKQREDQIKAQREDAGKPLMLTKMTCVICMDTPTDLTATNCGMSPFFLPSTLSLSPLSFPPAG